MIQHKVIFTCDAKECDRSQEVLAQGNLLRKLNEPPLPQGWVAVLINGLPSGVFCDKHDLKVEPKSNIVVATA